MEDGVADGLVDAREECVSGCGCFEAKVVNLCHDGAETRTIGTSDRVAAESESDRLVLMETVERGCVEKKMFEPLFTVSE
jgi:hypothetical protein